MEFAKYQIQAMRTNNFHEGMIDQVNNAALGLSGESGEICDDLKKVLYQGHQFNANKIFEELGDVLWYAAQMADALGVGLDEVAQMNIDKLRERYPAGFDSKRSINREAAK
jgi:NTP pyrophosphatase (non-canonical NTP hydrolase)